MNVLLAFISLTALGVWAVKGPAGSTTAWLPTRANQRCRLRSPSARLAFSLSLTTKS
jgi:hypothetical protein